LIKTLRRSSDVTEEILDLAPLDELLNKMSAEGQGLIPVLQQAQEIYGYLPKEVLTRTAQIMGLPESQVLGVASFYSQFHLEPRGRHIIQQCDGTACHVRGSNKIVAAIEDQLGIAAGETTEDLRATYEVVYCLGSCALAPVAVVDNKVVGRLTTAAMADIVSKLD
jgi:NADH-quinone oxidoreductase subunit E